MNYLFSIKSCSGWLDVSTKYRFSFLVHWFYHFWGSLRIAKRLPETADNTLSACFVHTSRFTAKVIRLLCPMLFLNLRVSEREHRVLGIPGYRVSLGSQLMPVSDPLASRSTVKRAALTKKFWPLSVWGICVGTHFDSLWEGRGFPVSTVVLFGGILMILTWIRVTRLLFWLVIWLYFLDISNIWAVIYN